MTFLPLFGHTEAVLGESTFEGSNKLQMKKFLLFWKLYLNIFPMSYHELNLDAEKASKRDLKVALCVGPLALRVGQILHRMAIFLCFDYVHGFFLMEDILMI